MPTATQSYDVIVIGGRPAGATLAARLGLAGVRVLLIDRSPFPSLPPVSSPIIYPCTMALLDEIGAIEGEYAYQTAKIRKVVTEAGEKYRGVGTIPTDRGRDYAYAVDRARFDATMWSTAAALPTVTALSEFSAVEVLWDGDRVIGIMGKPKGGEAQPYYADLVVGADGRSSWLARKVSATEYNVHDGKPVTYYYAYWKNVDPYDIDEPLLLTHGNLEGFGYLIMDSADGSKAITLGGYSSTFESIDHTDVTDLYLKVLQRAPRIWERLTHAERIGDVRGLKNVPNFYRHPYGAGWALVGDAAHHKDPLGGQGIYDAVFGARAFAEQYLAYRGGVAWETAMNTYKTNLEAETLTYYRNTLAGTDNYGQSLALVQMLGRYACENPEFINRMLSVPARTIDPAKVADPGLVGKTIATGVVRDVRRRLTGAPSPAAVPPLPGGDEKRIQNVGCLGWMVLLPALVWLNGGRKG